MNYIWAGMMLISIFCAFITGRVDQLSSSILTGAEDSITLVIAMFGMMCLWTGLMKIADKGGLTSILARWFSPVLKLLFPDYSKDSKALRAICMNITANILGLGNAATPAGIKAMQEMEKLNPNPKTANNSMVMFVVINTASLQLVPTFLSMLRQKHGATSPFDIMPAVWITSVTALVTGIIAAKLLERR